MGSVDYGAGAMLALLTLVASLTARQRRAHVVSFITPPLRLILTPPCRSTLRERRRR